MRVNKADLGLYFALGVLTLCVIIGLYALVSFPTAHDANTPGNYCIPNTSQCITPAVPMYCNRYEYVCITAIPANQK